MKDDKIFIGKDIYVPTQLHLSRGSDDVVGGLGKITDISEHISGGEPCLFVEVEEHPNKGYNWTQCLSEEQDELKKRFGNNRAYPAPDIDTPWIESGDLVNGKIYKGEPIW